MAPKKTAASRLDEAHAAHNQAKDRLARLHADRNASLLRDDDTAALRLDAEIDRDAMARKKPVKKRRPRRKKRPAPLPEGLDFSDIGPAMQALPSDRHRHAVRTYVLFPDKGRPFAMRCAGLDIGCRDRAIAGRYAWNFFHRENVVRAVAEECKRALRAGHPQVVRNVLKIANGIERNPMAALKANQLILDRVDPVALDVHHTHEHVHDLSPTARADVLRNIVQIAKQAGVTLKSLPPMIDITPEVRDDDDR